MKPLTDNSTFDEIAQVVGEAPARALCDHLGGTTLYVPAQVGVHHPIAVAIGMDAAARFSSHFRGSHLQLPKTYLRRQKVIELRRTTRMTVREIALACDYSEFHVYTILKQDRGDDGQLDMFRDL